MIWFVIELVGSWRGGLRSPELAHVPIWEKCHVIGICLRCSTTCWPGTCCRLCFGGAMQSTSQQHMQASWLRPVPILQPFRPLSCSVRRSRRVYRCPPSALAVQDFVDTIQSSPVLSGAVATTGETADTGISLLTVFGILISYQKLGCSGWRVCCCLVGPFTGF